MLNKYSSGSSGQQQSGFQTLPYYPYGRQPAPSAPARPVQTSIYQTPVTSTSAGQNMTPVPNQTPIPQATVNQTPVPRMLRGPISYPVGVVPTPTQSVIVNPQALAAVQQTWSAPTATEQYTPQGLTFSTELPPLDPAAMESYRARRAAAQAAYEQVIADVQRGRRSARSLMRQTTRNIARQAGGTGQDLRSNLGSTGLQESPGVIGPAIDYVNAAAARERAAARRSFADTIAGLEAQRAQAGAARRQSMADLMAWKVNQQQQQLQNEWQKMINEYNYGGGAQ